MDGSTNQNQATEATTETGPRVTIGSILLTFAGIAAFIWFAESLQKFRTFQNDEAGTRTCDSHTERYIKTGNNIVSEGRIFVCAAADERIMQRFVAKPLTLHAQGKSNI